MVRLQSRILTLIYVERGNDIRVISFRASSRVERRAYEKARAEESDRLGSSGETV